MFGQHSVLLIKLENLLWNTGNRIQGIDDIASLIAVTATQLEPQREDNNGAIQTLKESRDSNKGYLDQTANLKIDDL
jgi:hypothetical protein